MGRRSGTNDLKFHQGMILSGCYVFPFSINDRARQLTWTNAKMFGMKKANQALIKTCRTILPDALILGHGQHISAETIQKIRESVPEIRIGYWYVDPLWDPPKSNTLSVGLLCLMHLLHHWGRTAETVLWSRDSGRFHSQSCRSRD